MNNKLIALTGPAGSGKDTVADYLVSTYNYKRYAIASPLKAGLAAMGFPEPEDRRDKERLIDGFDFSWREAAQTLGTEWGRSLDNDIWLKLSYIEITGKLKTSDVVITDVRFDNEADVIKKLGGRVIAITGRSVDLKALSSHGSEAGISLEYIDYALDNSRSIDDLYKQIEVKLNV